MADDADKDVEMTPRANNNNNDEVESVKDTAATDAPVTDAMAQAKQWGLQPPEILRNMTAEERAALEKKLRRKIDLRLLPMIILMYILNYIDRYDILRLLW